MESKTRLMSAMVQENPIRQVLWHPSRPELVITTANNAIPAARWWSLDHGPAIIRIPISRSETGRYDVKWVVTQEHDYSKFWFGTAEESVVGYLIADDGTPQFEVLNSLSGSNRT